MYSFSNNSNDGLIVVHLYMKLLNDLCNLFHQYMIGMLKRCWNDEKNSVRLVQKMYKVCLHNNPMPVQYTD